MSAGFGSLSVCVSLTDSIPWLPALLFKIRKLAQMEIQIKCMSNSLSLNPDRCSRISDLRTPWFVTLMVETAG